MDPAPMEKVDNMLTLNRQTPFSGSAPNLDQAGWIRGQKCIHVSILKQFIEPGIGHFYGQVGIFHRKGPSESAASSRGGWKKIDPGHPGQESAGRFLYA